MMFVPMERRNVLTMMDRLLPIARADHRPRCATSASIARLKVGHDVLRPTALLALTEGAHCWRVPPISDRGFQMRISETRICLLRIVRHETVTFSFGTCA
jgi:hypothetical protein